MAREQAAVLTGGAREIAPATGKLGVMLVGLGAVSTTFIAGVENVRRMFGAPHDFAAVRGRPAADVGGR